MKLFKNLLFSVVIAIALLPLSLTGQESKIGQKDLNLGVGFGTLWITEGYYTIIPPVAISLDYALREDWGPGIFTVGGYIGISRYANERSWNNIGTYEYYGYKYNTTIFAARSTYHYELFNNFDTYVGAMAGFRITTHGSYGTWPAGPNDFDTDASFMPLARFFVGAKYNFTEKLACFGEIGYGISYFTLGLSVKI